MMDTKATYNQGKKIYGNPVRLIMSVLIILAFTYSAFAGTPGKMEAREMVKAGIMNKIECPDFITHNGSANYVRAMVEVNSDGELTISDISAGSPELKQYILNRLNNTKVLYNQPVDADKFVLIIKFQI
jgi:hypothetical protein